MKNSICLFSLFFLVSSFSFGQTPERTIAILDLTDNNNETNDAQLFSTVHMAKITGIPFQVIQDVEEATNYAMILSSSRFANSTFTENEESLLETYVQEGGLLVVPRIQNEDFFNLFGIDDYESINTRFEIRWDSTLDDVALKYIDEPEERTLSLGRNTLSSIFKTVGYSTTSATTLAHYEDGSPAIIKNEFGLGHAVSVGLAWKEVILRSQINRDYEAQRISSNGFEPTSDMFGLFIRALFLEHHPHTVWKNTSPGKSSSTLMITHDVDSRTGMDTLEIFADFEKNNNIEATYNITVRYFDDDLMDDYYLNRQSTLDFIQNKGHNFGSHSVGHFFDFGDDSIFPIGNSGNTITNYQPYNNGIVTTGGTVYGELEVSKNVLEADIANQTIRVFRAGHLAVHKNLIDVLDDLDYQFNSSNSASDLLTNFPFQNKKGRTFSGANSDVYEITVTLSDVFHDNPISIFNHFAKANIWLDVTQKNNANGAPNVLLIHPNRHYKLETLSYFLDELPADINLMEMEKFGNFWKAREAFVFDSELAGNDLTITIPQSVDLMDNISFIVADGQSLSSISIKDDLGMDLNFTQDNWSENDVIVYFTDLISSSENIVKLEDHSKLTAFPNPTKSILNLKFEVSKSENIQIDLYDVDGKKVSSLLNEKMPKGKHHLQKSIPLHNQSSGIYFIFMKNDLEVLGRTKIVIE